MNILKDLRESALKVNDKVYYLNKGMLFCDGKACSIKELYNKEYIKIRRKDD